MHAQSVAEQHYLALGFDVADVHTRESYDLRCTKGELEVHVEAKGATGEGTEVFLTQNEVLHAREHRVALVIVSQISLNRSSTPPVASGGVMRVFDPWDVTEGTLTPVQYRYAPEARP